MKAFLQSSMTIILGLGLLYAFYQKKSEQSQLVQASDIEMDSLFFVDQQAFKNKQLAVNQVNTEAILLKAESMNKADSVKLISTISNTQTKRKEKPKIEIYELKKAPKANLANSQQPDNKLSEVISLQLSETTSAEAATASIANAHFTTQAAADEQLSTEKKKKFLFFNKKNKNE